MTQQQLRERASLLTSSIKELEKQAMLVQANRNGRADGEFYSEVSKIQNEITNRKSVLLKIVQAMHSAGGMTAGQPGPGGPGSR